MDSELHGGRWIWAEPSQQQVSEWFRTQPLHEGMTHEPYEGGVVLIPASEKYWHPVEKQNGEVEQVEDYRRTWTPYITVSTRVRYFRDYVALLNGGRTDGIYRGEIAPAIVREITEGPFANMHLPYGFSLYAVKQGERVVPYVVCTISVSIYERRSQEVLLEATDSRQVPAGDPFALMKARTGAIGRALGVAGILVTSGGVASAEEAQEAAEPARRSDPATDLAVETEGLPEPPTTPEGLRARARELRGQLAEHPQAGEAFNAWYQERGFGAFDSLTTGDLETLVRKLERDLDELPIGGTQ